MHCINGGVGSYSHLDHSLILWTSWRKAHTLLCKTGESRGLQGSCAGGSLRVRGVSVHRSSTGKLKGRQTGHMRELEVGWNGCDPP